MDAFNFKDILNLLQDAYQELEEISDMAESLPASVYQEEEIVHIMNRLTPSLKLRERLFSAIEQLERRCL